jgi:hypothetical protein
MMMVPGELSAASLDDPSPIDRNAITSGFGKPGYSPYAGRNFPTRVLFGDTHHHTGLSGDAFGFGNKLGVDEAFRFARGEEITTATGQRAQLSRPLDFLVNSDHAEVLGTMFEVYSGNPNLLKDPTVRRWHQMLNSGGEESFKAVMEMITSVSDKSVPKVLLDPKFARSIWSDYIAKADSYNEPGVFTAFIGYEWSSHPGGDNQHRVVVFRDDAQKAGQIVPFSAFDSEDPEDLWQMLGAYEEKTGGEVLAIPHNGNLSNGTMFNVETQQGQPLNKDYAEQRMRWEPIYEVTQIKGDGETHPILSPTDEFADYETWDTGNLDLSAMKTPEMLKYEYGRSGLKLGLEQEAKLGTNPFKFGMVGSTDSHTAMATAAEENFFGKHSGSEPSPDRWKHPIFDFGGVRVMGWQQASSGLAVVWATENTREAIFDAMMRKETYATTGSRMQVRFFGGWDFTADDAKARLPADIGYRKGVPMGGDLQRAPDGKVPSFLVAALKDPYNGNLDRIQIVKGWLDKDGKTHEKVYDVAWSGDREPGADGKLPLVGNTVDIANATWSNTIGAPELITVWQDPEFDPAQPAFYYVRVIEIPTPRWTAYDAKRYGVKMDANVPMTTQERAYTSPIWYTP